MLPDTILVLGGGIFPDGTLTNLSRQRLDKAVSLYQQGEALSITVLGARKSTYLPDAIEFPEAGAQLRARYLVAQGIPGDRIVRIEDGIDTIGEALACRDAFSVSHTHHFILVTSALHMKRAQWLFETLLGADYKVVPRGVDCGGLLSAAEEAEYLAATQSYFRTHPHKLARAHDWHTDNPALYRVFKNIHDGYHPLGRESEAYIGVRSDLSPLKT